MLYLEKILNFQNIKKFAVGTMLTLAFLAGDKRTYAEELPTSFKYGNYSKSESNLLPAKNNLKNWLEGKEEIDANNLFNGYSKIGINLNSKTMEEITKAFAKGANDSDNFVKIMPNEMNTKLKALAMANLAGGYVLSIYNDSGKKVDSKEVVSTIKDFIYYDTSKSDFIHNKKINCKSSVSLGKEIINEAIKINNLNLRAWEATTFGWKRMHSILPVRDLDTGEIYNLDYSRIQRTGTWDASEAMAVYIKDRSVRVLFPGELILFDNGIYYSRTNSQEFFEKTISPFGVLSEDFGKYSMRFMDKKTEKNNGGEIEMNDSGYKIRLFSNGTANLFFEKQKQIVKEYGDYNSEFDVSKFGIDSKYFGLNFFDIVIKDDRISLKQEIQGPSMYARNIFPLFSGFSLGIVAQYTRLMNKLEGYFLGDLDTAVNLVKEFENGLYLNGGIDGRSIFWEDEHNLRISGIRVGGGVNGESYNLNIGLKKQFADDIIEKKLYDESFISGEVNSKYFSLQAEYSIKNFHKDWKDLYVNKENFSLSGKWNPTKDIFFTAGYNNEIRIYRDFKKDDPHAKIGLKLNF